MGQAKNLLIEPVSSKIGAAFIRREHYSHSVCGQSQLHFGVFWRGRMCGAMQFGPSLDKSKLIGLVANTPWNGFVELNRNTPWNGFVELNRMAFNARLPRNSESRAISVAMRLLRRHAPHVQWVVSYADGCQCGDGTIYRAAGFALTLIKPNSDIYGTPDGRTVHSMSIKASKRLRQKYGSWRAALAAEWPGAEKLNGFQLRYIYFLDPTAKGRVTVPILPYSAIADAGAKMYKGKRPTGELVSHGASSTE